MEEELIFLLVPDTRWAHSYLILPARAVDSGEFYSYQGQFTAPATLLPVENELLALSRTLEPAFLYKTYGTRKYKTERDFVLHAEEEVLKPVRAFTDTVVASMLDKMKKSHIPLYQKKNHLDNPRKSDRILFSSGPVKVLTGFYRTEEQIRYRLTLLIEGKEIIPSAKDVHIVTHSPGWLLIEDKLYALPEGFNGVRLKPFLEKRDVLIPRQNEKEYFRKFILKHIGNENIEVEGFEILNRQATPEAILYMERDVTGQPLMELRFRYNNRTVSLSSDKPAIVELEEEGDQYRFYKTQRDYTWEARIHAWLLKNGLEVRQPDYYKVTGENSWPEVVEWIRCHQQVLNRKHVQIEQERLPVRYYTGNWTFDYEQQTTRDWFQLHARVILDNGEVIPFQELWKNILSGDREYDMGKDHLFIIPEEWFSRYTAIMLFGQKTKESLSLQRNQFSLLEGEAEVPIVPDQSEPVEVPAKLNAVLREYQLAGYRWLYHLCKNRMGACLADDMGLGKTIQTIALLLKYKEERKKEGGEFSTCLIVAPASVVHNWRNELHTFAPSLTVAEYTGPSRMGMRPALMRWEVVVTTYQTLRNDIDFLQKCAFGIVVLDESQSFKNRDSQVYQAVTLIRGDHFIALSGTPIENSLSDLWSLMSVINPGLLGNHATFYNYFIRSITVDVKGQHSEALRKLIHPFILRRTKEEVLNDLPERTDELIICETDPEQQKMYDEELSKARNRILESKLLQEKSGTETFGSLQAIMRLRQIANHPRLADPEYTHSSGKFREIFRMLEELVNTPHKVLLFSDYVTYLELAGEEMQNRGWEYAMLTGKTTQREEVIRSFATRPQCHFFLISLKAGGVGLNLTEADYVFILDPWWNLAAEEQAISRSHRIGQKRAVFVYRFITTGTLEEKILYIQQQKQDISDAIISLEETQFHPTGTELEKLLTE